MKRQVVIDGKFYLVECAVDASGHSPAARFLDDLKEGMWAGDPHDTDRPSDEQIYDYEAFLDRFQVFADTGEPKYARAVNYLRDGIWEFKFHNKRVTFYDTDGHGGFTPKAMIADAGAGVIDSEHWWFPDFDEEIRLGHCFLKDGEKAREADIRQALQVRKEDLRHDQDT